MGREKERESKIEIRGKGFGHARDMGYERDVDCSSRDE